MDEKTRLQVICLQVLSLVSLFLGRLPKVQTVVDILTHLVTEHWDELFSLASKKAAGKKVMARAKKELLADPKKGSAYLAFPDGKVSQEVRDVLDRVADEFGQGGENGDGETPPNEGGQPAKAGKGNGNGGGQFRH